MFPTSITKAQIRRAFRCQRAAGEYSGIASTGKPRYSTAKAPNAFHCDTSRISRSWARPELRL